MGLMDKAKFWKKDDDLGDLSDLGDFGLEDGPGGAPDDLAGTSLDSPGGSPDMDMSGGDFGQMPSMDSPGPTQIPPSEAIPGGPTHKESVSPSSASQQMSDSLGLSPAAPSGGQRPMQPPLSYPSQGQAAQRQPMQSQQAQYQEGYQAQQQYYPQQYQSGPDIADVAKEMEIVHAKLDAIRSTLDSINQRLATLERVATGSDQQQRRYQW